MKNIKIVYLSLACLLLIGCMAKKEMENGKNWQKIKTVEQLWKERPGQLHSLFSALNLERSGLIAVKDKLNEGDTIQAAMALLSYYRHINRDWIPTTLDFISNEEALLQANSLRNDSVIRHGKSYEIPINPDGGWKWDYIGPDKDDEFGYGLNGTKYFPSLYTAWKKTGEENYIVVFDKLMRDWILHHPLPVKGDSVYMAMGANPTLDYRDIGEVEWRTLETGNRLGVSWPQLFYAFQSEEEFNAATRLLMLSSLAVQASFLQKRHKTGHNWTTMEMNGLALAGLSFPEFKEAENWSNYALDVMEKEINRQVYPDGVQTEISSKTQWVALNRFETLAANFLKANKKITKGYLTRVEEMYDYLAYTMRSDGHQPLNNDSDRDDLKPRILQAAKKFERPDWEWIATNGKRGVLPKKNPSLTYPWAGIHIMRNGWKQDADWSFFDVGPYGTGHQHRDKLHLSVMAFGEDILVDGGRYTHKDYFNFDPSSWRGYFRSSYSHNVLLVDGNGQKEGAVRADRPLVEGDNYIHNPLYDYAYGVFRDGYENIEGQAIHSRSVIYLKDQYWVVLDHFETDRARKIQALWHYAPKYQVEIEGKEVVSINIGEPNLRIIPIGDIPWKVQIVKGQEEPVKQGWYSSVFGEKVANSTVVYSAEIKEDVTFAWILMPAQGPVPKIKSQFSANGSTVKITVEKKNGPATTFTLPVKKNIRLVKVDFREQ